MKFYYSILTILIALVAEFLTSLLFNWLFIQNHITRQILVYVIMLIIAYIAFRLVQEINK